MPQNKTKRASAKKQTKTMTLNQSRPDSTMMNNEYASRTATSLSPEPSQLTRPRKVKMPTVMNPECLFMARTSKNVLQRVKLNLAKLCDVDR